MTIQLNILENKKILLRPCTCQRIPLLTCCNIFVIISLVERRQNLTIWCHSWIMLPPTWVSIFNWNNKVKHQTGESKRLSSALLVTYKIQFTLREQLSLLKLSQCFSNMSCQNLAVISHSWDWELAGCMENSATSNSQMTIILNKQLMAFTKHFSPQNCQLN